MSVVVALVALAFGNLINNGPDEQGDALGFVILGLITIAVAIWMFKVFIPRSQDAAVPADRVSKRGLIASIAGLVTVAVFWTGLPFVLGPGGALLGKISNEKQGGEGSGRATAARIIGVLAFVLAVAAVVLDEVA